MPSEDYDRIIMACYRVGSVEEKALLPGSTHAVCIDCGHKVWVSKSGVGTMRIKGAQAICFECIPDGDLEVLPPTEEQIAEVKQELKNGRR